MFINSLIKIDATHMLFDKVMWQKNSIVWNG